MTPEQDAILALTREVDRLQTALAAAEGAVVDVDLWCDDKGCGKRSFSAREVFHILTAKGIDVAVLAQAYDWTFDREGEIAGLTAGDQNYEPTGIKVPDIGKLYAREEQRADKAEARAESAEQQAATLRAAAEGGWDTETVKRQVADFNALCDAVRNYRARADAAEQRAAMLRAALVRFGQHLNSCACMNARLECNCGLDAAQKGPDHA